LASVQSGPEWTLSFRAPLLANGTYPLTVSATGPNGTTVAPAGAELELTAALSALLEERTMPDGTRHVSLRLQSAQQVDVPLAGLVAVLVREDARGFNETRSVTLDASGAASLDFDATPGPIRLLALRDSGVTLADVEQRMTQAGATIKDVNPPVPLWVWITAGGLFAAGAAAVAAALLWRRRQRQALRDGFLEGRRLLLDPRATPAQAIQAIYAHLLACLSQSGFRLLPQQTARDIAQLAVSDLRLPAPPMRALTGLFERARYSTAGLTVAQRDEARAAVETVLARLGGTT
jgi:hypothetical protein